MKRVFIFVWFSAFCCWTADYFMESDGEAEICYASELCNEPKACEYPSEDAATRDAQSHLENYSDIFSCTLLNIISSAQEQDVRGSTTCYTTKVSAKFKCKGYW